MSKIKNGGLDQYGAEPFEQHQFGTAGVERVNKFPEISGNFALKISEVTALGRNESGTVLCCQE